MPNLKNPVECNGKRVELKNLEQDKMPILKGHLRATKSEPPICNGKTVLENGIEPLCTSF